MPATIRFLPMVAMLAMLPTMAAAGQGMPSQDEVEQARKMSQAAIANLKGSRSGVSRSMTMPSAADLSGVPRPSMPRVEVTRPNIDLADMVDRFKAGMRQASESSGSDVLVFISLSMPRASLSRLVDQVARADGSLVIRGLHGESMRETLHKVNEILDGRNVSWLIDPESFRRYGVSQVPAFVLAHGPGQGTCPKSVPAGDYVMVAGDVSLDYAMEMIGRSSDVWRPMAMHIADEVRGGRQ